MDRRIAARDLATLTDLDALAVSPDGRWAAFQTRRADPDANSYELTWYVASTRGGSVRRVGDGGSVIQPANQRHINGFIQVPPAAWSPDSRWIAYLRKEGGRTQVWRSRADAHRTEQLTHNDGEVQSAIFSDDGRRLFFETQPSRAQTDAALAKEGLAGYRFDDRFVPSYGPLPTFPARAMHAAREVAKDLWVYEIDSRRERIATATERNEFKERQRTVRRTNISSEGSLATEEPFGNRGELHVAVKRPDGTSVVCGHAECTSERLLGFWWRDENEVIFARREIPITRLFAWRIGGVAPRPVLTTPDMLIAGSFHWSCAIGAGRLICFDEQPDYPRRLVAVNLDSGVMDTLYDPNPVFAQFDLGPAPQYLRIEADSGVSTYGYLVLPPDRRPGQRLPLIVVTYVCNRFLRGGTGDEYPLFPFAAQGFAVLCFSTPDTDPARRRTMDATAYEDWFRGPGDAEKHAVQRALDAAIEQLDTAGIIDPHRVGLTGLSFGAETVTFALFHMPRLAAAIASQTEIGPSGIFLGRSTFRERLRTWGLDKWDSTRWDTLSVTRSAERVRAPLLLNVSDHELMTALHTHTALEQAGRAVEMYVFPDSYHIKHQPAHRLAIYNRNIDWMNFWLRGVEDPSPAKSGQYGRWRAMRAKQCELFKGEDAPWYCQQ